MSFRHNFDLIIPAGQSVSNVADFQFNELRAIEMPELWDPAWVGLQVSADPEGPFKRLYSGRGEILRIPVAAGRRLSFPMFATQLLTWRFMRLESLDPSKWTSAPVVQTADRLVRLVLTGIEYRSGGFDKVWPTGV